jgi:tRNA/rRNA methyltransferase
MNLGQAVAVCLYELVRGRKKTSARILAGKKEKTRPTSADVERLTQALLEVLRASGYVKPRTIAAEEKSRRLLRRMELSANDAEVWLGMLRQIAWKLGVRE